MTTATYTRAIDNPKAKLIERPHLNQFFQDVITIIDGNGLKREIPYSHDDIANPLLTEAMLQDTLNRSTPLEVEVYEVTKKFCLEMIEGDAEITIGELNLLAATYSDGYETAYKRYHAK